MADVDSVNKWLDKYYSPEVFEQLEIKNCMDELMNASSTIEKISFQKKCFTEALSPFLFSKKLEKAYAKFFELTSESLIPAGTKGVIRGNKLRDIIYRKLCSIIDERIDGKEFTIIREPSKYTGNTKPDILISKNDIKLQLFVQIDFHTGGQQSTRGKEYAKNRVNIICNKPKTFRSKTKIFDIYNTAIKKKNLYYSTNLDECLEHFFPVEILEE
jgi:hypothetical protein